MLLLSIIALLVLSIFLWFAYICLMGRKQIYNPENFKPEILEWISEGKTLRDYCRQEGKPKYVTIYSWLAADKEFAEHFAHARDSGHDVIADECMAIAREKPPVLEKGQIDAGYVSWQKNQIWTNLQLLSKWNPRKYGEAKQKVELSGPAGGPVQIQSTVIDGRDLDEESLEALVAALKTVAVRSSVVEDPYIDEDEEADD